MALPGILSNPSQTLRQWENSLIKRQKHTSHWVAKNFPSFKTVAYNLRVTKQDFAIKKIAKFAFFFFLSSLLSAAHFCRSFLPRFTLIENYIKIPKSSLADSCVKVPRPDSGSNGESTTGSDEVESKERPRGSHTKRGRRELRRQQQAAQT